MCIVKHMCIFWIFLQTPLVIPVILKSEMFIVGLRRVSLVVDVALLSHSSRYDRRKLGVVWVIHNLVHAPSYML